MNNRQQDLGLTPAVATAQRKRAEEQVRIMEPTALATHTPEAIQRMLHELQVRQIELEMQNEQLRTTQAQTDAERIRYYDLYDEAPVGYCTLSGQGVILEANLTAATLLGTTRNELVRQPLSRFIHRDDQDIYDLHRRQLVKTDTLQRCDLRLVKPDGGFLWAHLKGTVDQADDGALVCRVVVSDITERKREEEETKKLQERLIQAQKMETVGQLAGGVAHDFNNMLSVILGYAEMGLEQVPADQPMYKTLRGIQQAARHSADLTRQLLAFARKQTIAPRVLDLNMTVEGMLTMLRRLIGEDIDLIWRPGRNLHPIKMDPTQIDQILANLCVNARDAIEGAGMVTIETSNTVCDAEHCARHTGLVPGQYVLLEVSDNGCGMDRETINHLFEPFFTTKEQGKGTGLGLASVYGAVAQNNGFINVDSDPGQGATFQIYLPQYLAATEALPIPNTVPVKAAARGHETILLVEDEPTILKMTTKMLELQGYTVVPAATPNDAIRLAGEHPGHIDLLMTDVVMPKMNGLDLAKNILSVYPNMKCLFMSGYTASVIAHHGIMDQGVHFIQKPFVMKDLGGKLREVLDR